MFARLTKFAGTAVIATGLGLVAFAGGAIASAATGSVDEAFLDDISSYDIAFATPADAISDAHGVCTLLDGGVSHQSITEEVFVNSGLDHDQSNYFVEAAELAYCPEYF